MPNRYNNQENRYAPRRQSGHFEPPHTHGMDQRLNEDERWKPDRSRYQSNFDSDEMYGGRGDDRNFNYDFEQGSDRGYRGMSNRQIDERFDNGLSQRSRYGVPGNDPYRSSSSLPMEGRGRYEGRGPKGYRRSDERIEEEINEQLTRHPDVDASDIEVKVKDGEVTLSGTVVQRHCKRMAEDISENISGVKDVHNHIRVQAQGLVSPTHLSDQSPRESSKGVSDDLKGQRSSSGVSRTAH